MVGADGEVGRRRPRLDLLVRAIEEWESILSGGGGVELDGTLLARLEKMVGPMVRTGNSTVGLGRPSSS